MYFLDGDAYAPYATSATCMATPLKFSGIGANRCHFVHLIRCKFAVVIANV